MHASVRLRKSEPYFQRVRLRDHATHGDAHQVEVADAELVHKRLRVVGEQLGTVWALGGGALADPAVVEAQHAEAGVENRSASR